MKRAELNPIREIRKQERRWERVQVAESSVRPRAKRGESQRRRTTCLVLLRDPLAKQWRQKSAGKNTMQHGLASHQSPVSTPGAWANWPGCSSVLPGLCLEELSNGTTELRCDLLLEMSRLGSSPAGKGLPWTEIGKRV